MRRFVWLACLLACVSAPGAKPKTGAVSVNEGNFSLKIKAGDREVGLTQSNFDDFSGSLSTINGRDSQVSISGANNKDDQNLNVLITVGSQTQGTFEVGNGQPNHFEFHASAFPQPETAPFFVVKQGTLEITSYPGVGGFASGTFHGTCQWLGMDMQPVQSFEADLSFRVKRLH